MITYLIAVADAKAFLLVLNKAVSGREVSAELLLPVLGDLDDRQIKHWKELLRNSIRGERVLFLDVGLPPSPAALQKEPSGERPGQNVFTTGSSARSSREISA